MAQTGEKAKIGEIWQRFPKFILGFMLTFAAGLTLAWRRPRTLAAKLPAAIGEANTFRVIFFILTFFSIGVLSNFRKLWQDGIGKLAAVYAVSLFGFVIWVGPRRSPGSSSPASSRRSRAELQSARNTDHGLN